MQGGIPKLEKEALFERLAQGHAARITVVTPNRRLARALEREHSARQAARGLSVWESPDILPFTAFARRLWEDALHSPLGESVPHVLATGQEQALWEGCVRHALPAGGLLSIPATAAQCMDA